MTRRSGFAAGLAFALALGARGAAAQDEKVEIRTVPVAAGLHMLVGSGGNIGVSSGPDGVFLIDDQYAPLTPKIRAAVAKISDAPPRFVINTHWHTDHTGGNEGFAGLGALIIAHDNVRRRMSTQQFIEAFGRSVPASPAAALPVVTFGADLTLHWNADEIHAIHVENAHTDGDSIVHFRKANAIHAGDVYFANGYPFIDLSTGGSIAGMIAAVDRILSLADAKTAILPGHGELSDRAGLLGYRTMLVAARDRIQKAIAAGKSADALVAERPLAEFDAQWGAGFVKPEVFVRSVYASLSAR